jgi:hypothetical protein
MSATPEPRVMSREDEEELEQAMREAAPILEQAMREAWPQLNASLREMDDPDWINKQKGTTQ